MQLKRERKGTQGAGYKRPSSYAMNISIRNKLPGRASKSLTFLKHVRELIF